MAHPWTSTYQESSLRHRIKPARCGAAHVSETAAQGNRLGRLAVQAPGLIASVSDGRIRSGRLRRYCSAFRAVCWVGLIWLGLSSLVARGQETSGSENKLGELPGNGAVIALWDGGAPGFEARREEPEEAESYWVKNIHHPSLTAFLPDAQSASGAAVVICPGGGHRLLVYDAEGVAAAKYLSQIGVAAFVLKYRLGREQDSPYEITTHALQDGQRAIRLVRANAERWGIDQNRIGMLGFSAGGEVVSMVAYAESDGDATAKDPIDRESAKLDFQMLVYPGPIGIPDSIPTDAPPAFLTVANDDRGAAKNIVDLLVRMRAASVPVEAHIYARGGHAFNMGQRSKLATLQSWPDRMRDWMQDNAILGGTDSTD